jgi:hypothetical protein
MLFDAALARVGFMLASSAGAAIYFAFTATDALTFA